MIEPCATSFVGRTLTDFCYECDHAVLVHTQDRTCTICALEARQVEIEQRFIEAVGALRADWEAWLAKNDHLIPRLIGGIATQPEQRQLHRQGEGPLYSPNGPQTGLASPLGLMGLLDRALESVPQDARERRPDEIAG